MNRYENSVTDLIRNVWEHVGMEYRAGKIPSKQHLSALFLGLLQPSDYDIFIQPKLDLGATCNQLQAKEPDLLLTQENEVKAVIHLNYAPSGGVHFDDSLALLNAFNQASDSCTFPLTRDAKTGTWNEQDRYSIASGCVFGLFSVAWAKTSVFHLDEIHNSDYESLRASGRFIQGQGKISKTGAAFSLITGATSQRLSLDLSHSAA
jgi:hypothetical protein